MAVIDYYPTPHRSVEFAVAASVVNNAVTSLRVILRSVGAITAPLTFITDNSLEHEVISKAGLDEELAVDFTTGTLVSSEVSGPYYIYTLTFPVASSSC